jgi:hypothetical protein
MEMSFSDLTLEKNILISLPPIFNERFQNFIFLKSFEIEFATRDQNMNGLWHEERR